MPIKEFGPQLHTPASLLLAQMGWGFVYIKIIFSSLNYLICLQ